VEDKPPLSRYQANAEECLRMAETAQDPEHRNSWIRLAASWLRMIPRRETPAPAAPTAEEPGSKKMVDRRFNPGSE
jgi:hypothetical protein